MKVPYAVKVEAASGSVRGDAETFEMQQSEAMQQPRWNDGRLDDLNRKVDDGIGRLDEERKDLRGEMRAGFDKVEGEFKAVRGEMREGFAKVDDEFKAVRGEMKEGFVALDSKLDRLMRSFLAAAVAIIVALVSAPHI